MGTVSFSIPSSPLSALWASTALRISASWTPDDGALLEPALAGWRQWSHFPPPRECLFPSELFLFRLRRLAVLREHKVQHEGTALVQGFVSGGTTALQSPKSSTSQDCKTGSPRGVPTGAKGSSREGPRPSRGDCHLMLGVA